MLIWKLLRQHISIWQLVGFVVANLLGMLIVLLSIQLYQDIAPVFSSEDSFMPSNYLVLSKRITGTGGLLGNHTSEFTDDEIEGIKRQSFCQALGAFTASQYDVRASVDIQGVVGFSTDMFFEAVPDDFVETNLKNWNFDPTADAPEVPIILPRNYLAIYNFGFAQSRHLPKMSESLISNLYFNLRLRGNSVEGQLKGRIIGFGTRLNTILVPQSFINWSNQTFASSTESKPTRLIMKVGNVADDNILRYTQTHGYEIEDDKAESGKITFLLRLTSGIVMSVGLLISLLSFFILMLSIYLLVQKNTDKLQNLLLIGYSAWRIALPYQILSVAINALVLLLAIALLILLRFYYMDVFWNMFPTIDKPSMCMAYCVAVALFLLVSFVNIIIVRNKIKSLF